MQRLVPALDAAGGSIRLRDETTASTSCGLSSVQERCTGLERLDIGVIGPSDQVIATRKPVIDHRHRQVSRPDKAAVLPIRSCVSQPMWRVRAARRRSRSSRHGPIGSRRGRTAAGRRRRADRRRDSERAAPRFGSGAASGSGNERSTRSAIRSPCSIAAGNCCAGNTALAAHLGRPVTQLRQAS